MKNVECNAKEMFVALVAKTILKPQNGVLTPFKSATNLRQTKKLVAKIFLLVVYGTQKNCISRSGISDSTNFFYGLRYLLQ